MSFNSDVASGVAVNKRIEDALAAKAAKPRLHMLTPEMLTAALPAVEYGAKKYAPWDWLKAAEKGKMSFTSLLDATQRHVIAFAHTEDNDPESGLCHLHHAAANIGFLVTMFERRIGDDDRIWKPRS